MEDAKRGRGRPPKISKTAKEKPPEQQPGDGADMMDVVEPATREGQAQQAPPTAGEGECSAADGGAKAPKRRGRGPSTERYAV